MRRWVIGSVEAAITEEVKQILLSFSYSSHSHQSPEIDVIAGPYLSERFVNSQKV